MNRFGHERDWYIIAEQPAPAPHLARPEGRAALTHFGVRFRVKGWGLGFWVSDVLSSWLLPFEGGGSGCMGEGGLGIRVWGFMLEGIVIQGCGGIPSSWPLSFAFSPPTSLSPICFGVEVLGFENCGSGCER